MFETSKDILYLVLAFCVFWFTLFLCWALFYLIKFLKQANTVLADIRHKFEKVSSIFSILKTSIFSDATKGLVHLLTGFVKSKKTRKQKSKKA